MVMRPERHVLFKCPGCGDLGKDVVTVFSFSGNRSHRLKCRCGCTKATLATRDHKAYTVQFACQICEATHVVSLPANEFWQDPLVSVDCPETEVEVGFIGEPGKISRALSLQQSLGELMPPDGSVEGLFANPEAMYQILTLLHNIARTGNLYCECGNDNIEVDLYPDKLELRCPTCDSLSIIYAENDDDVAVMSRVEVIEMKRAGFTSVDATRFNPRHMRR